MNNLCYGMKVINITQLPGGSLSHPNNALDLAGSDTGIDFWFAQGDWKCIGGPWGNGTYFFVPVDSNGETTKVHCADGINRVVTLALTHSERQFVKTTVGKIYRNGEPMYEEGTKGWATGNHIHAEVAEGIQTTKYKGSDGTWRMKNELKILDLVYVNDSFSRVSEFSLGKDRLKHCATNVYGGDKVVALNGIDISNWQKDINLTEVLSKTPTDFVIMKATEGIDFIDKYFPQFAEAALKANKKIGFYHFARPEKNSAITEANYFYKQIKKYVGNAILILDWESSGKSDVAWAKRWLDELYALTKIKPMIYMSESVVNAYDWSAVAKASYGLWVAKYKDNLIDYNYDMSNAGAKPIVKYWNGYAMWQWTSSGRLTGYLGNLDCNIFYGDRTAWDKYSGAYGEWKKKDGKWYYYKNGKPLTGWHKLSWSDGTDWFYFDSDGVMLTGWQYLKWSGGKNWFYFDDCGAMLTGLHCLKWKDRSDWYYFDDKTGAMKTGEQTLMLYFDANGTLTGGKKA